MKRSRLIVILVIVVAFVLIVGLGDLGGEVPEDPIITLTYITPPSQLTTMEPDYTPPRTDVPGGFPYSLTGQGGAMDALLLVALVVLFLMVLRRRH